MIARPTQEHHGSRRAKWHLHLQRHPTTAPSSDRPWFGGLPLAGTGPACPLSMTSRSGRCRIASNRLPWRDDIDILLLVGVGRGASPGKQPDIAIQTQLQPHGVDNSCEQLYLCPWEPFKPATKCPVMFRFLFEQQSLGSMEMLPRPLRSRSMKDNIAVSVTISLVAVLCWAWVWLTERWLEEVHGVRRRRSPKSSAKCWSSPHVILEGV